MKTLLIVVSFFLKGSVASGFQKSVNQEGCIIKSRRYVKQSSNRHR